MTKEHLIKTSAVFNHLEVQQKTKAISAQIEQEDGLTEAVKIINSSDCSSEATASI